MLALIFVILSISLLTQNIDGHIKITEAHLADGSIDLVASNSGHCPYTVTLDAELRNVRSLVPLPATFVVFPEVKDQLLTTLRPDKNEKWSYRFKYSYQMGDLQSGKHDEEQFYLLPYEMGLSKIFMQGPDGKFSHQGVHAYDFGMPQGSPVHAARDGIVVMVREDSKKGCPQIECMKDANNILIWHQDGSFASYAHLQYQGSLVSPGDTVQAGDLIGLSGNTGWSSAPHLHFEVYLPQSQGRRTIPVRFLTPQGLLSELEVGREYQAAAVSDRR